MVRDVWHNSGEGGVWNLGFTISFNDWEVREVENFLLAIQPLKIISNREDKLILKGNTAGIYSVKLLYEVLNRPASSPMTFLVQSIWNPLVLLKVGFFAWEAVWGKVLTLNQLKRRRRPLASRCYLCENEEESIDHLLVHCQQARLLWEIILATVGMGWVFPFYVQQTLISWQGATGGKETEKSVEGGSPLSLLDSLAGKE